MFDKTKRKNDQTVVPPGGGTVEDNGPPRQEHLGRIESPPNSGCSTPPPPAQHAASAQPQQPHAEPAPPQSAGMNDRLAQLKQLGELLSAGVLTQAEFEQEKARILNG